MKRKCLKLAVGDIHDFFREMVKAHLESAGFSVVYDTYSGIELIIETYRQKPHVVIIDMELAILDGIQTAKLIRGLSPETKIMMLSKYGNSCLYSNLKNYIDGLLIKPFSLEIIEESVIHLINGENIFYSEEKEKEITIQRLNYDKGYIDENIIIQLTQREKEVIKCIISRMRNEEIAKKLLISKSTVKYHIKNILSKFQVSNRGELLKRFELKNYNL